MHDCASLRQLCQWTLKLAGRLLYPPDQDTGMEVYITEIIFDTHFLMHVMLASNGDLVIM